MSPADADRRALEPPTSEAPDDAAPRCRCSGAPIGECDICSGRTAALAALTREAQARGEACSTCGAPDFLFCACGALEAVRRHIAERTDGDCDSDSPQWDSGFKAACSQILAILDQRAPVRDAAGTGTDGEDTARLDWLCEEARFSGATIGALDVALIVGDGVAFPGDQCRDFRAAIDAARAGGRP